MTDPKSRAAAARPRNQANAEPREADEAEDEERTTVRVRPDRYLVAAVPAQMLPPSVAPLDGAALVEQLEKDPDVRVVRTIKPVQRLGGVEFPTIALVEMAADRAAGLAASPQIHIESDHWLGHGGGRLTYADPGLSVIPEGATVTFEVTDSDGQALAGVPVHVLSELAPVHGVTGGDGKVRLQVPLEEIERVRGVLARPRQDCWSTWLARPVLSATGQNAVVCNRLENSVAGWSRRAMGFDRLPPTYRGHGIRLAIVDSGASVDAGPLAARTVEGVDVLGQDDKSWRDDVIGFGTHTAGLIAATDESAKHIGLSPEIELHLCKVVPGGRYSDLIEALDYCIARDIDVVNLGVGGPYPSWFVAQKIEQARRAGIACVAGAGNTSGPVAFPATLPTVLAVAAVGQIGTFPPDSYHATQLLGPPTTDGYFAARFSAYGPEVDVCAPGVAVVSTVPAGALGALDGTAIAAAHVTALAALVLAHHADFRDGYRVRGPARVDRLHQIIRASCRPLPLGDPRRTGAGIPDAVAAVGLVPGVVTSSHPALDMLRAHLARAGLAPVGGLGTAEMSGGTGVGLLAPTAGPTLAALRTAMRSAGLATETPMRTTG